MSIFNVTVTYLTSKTIEFGKKNAKRQALTRLLSKYPARRVSPSPSLGR